MSYHIKSVGDVYKVRGAGCGDKQAVVTRSAADAMQRGDDVPPKLFSDASVFFCDIVNFQMMAMDSQPMDIVKLLNDIYTRFDDVIAKFKVYKVRTLIVHCTRRRRFVRD